MITLRIWQLSHQFHNRGWRLPALALRMLLILAFNASFHPETRPGKNIELMHFGMGVGINTNTLFGEDVRIMPHATVTTDVPLNAGLYTRLGDRVTVGYGAIIVGPVDIGDDVVIGAGAVVTKSVPDGAVVAGVPARVINMTGREYNLKRLGRLPKAA